MIRIQFLHLTWVALCVFLVTLRASAFSLPDEHDTVDAKDTSNDAPEVANIKVSANPPNLHISRPVSPAVSEALKILRSLQPKTIRVNTDKNNGMLSTSLYYAKEIFYLLFMNNIPIDSSTPRALSKPLQQATTILKTAASGQDADAMFLLAEMNFFGNYTYPRNYTEALVRYHDLAAFNGNSSAQHMLGFLYATGYEGAAQRDQAKALMYHTFAAKGGNIRSEMTVGYRHHTGVATPRNCNKAAHWYKKVADRAVAFSRSGPPGGQAMQRDAYKIADENGGVYGEGASVISSGVNANRAGPNSDTHAAFEDVLEYLDLMSRKGDLKATFSLGRLHYEGQRNMRRNLRTARKFFIIVARKYWQKDGSTREEDNGIAKIASKAAGYIGRMFLRGEGMEQSYEKALTWFRRGVKNGDALCQYELGIMYLNGLGVQRDPLLAGDYFRAAAEQDFASAQVNIGKLFLDQGNVPEATRYFDLAARHGHIEAFYHLAEINNHGIGRDRSCNMATAYYKLVAEKAENIHSAFDEANAAYNDHDIETALPIYMMAAEQGYESAQANVAYILDEYKSILSLSSLLPWKQRATTIKNPLLTLIYWTRSAKQSNIDSMVKMGDYYLKGAGVEADMEKAATCYQTAAETHQSAQALWNLGWIHENGIGVAQDFHLAKRFYDQALETNVESYLPVKLALVKLRVRSWWNSISGGGVNSIRNEPEAKPATPQSWSEFFQSFLNDPYPYYQNVDDPPPTDDEFLPEGMPGGDDDYYDDIDESLVESVVILGLMGVLGWLLWYRGQRAAGHRREMERTGNGDAGQGVQRVQGMQGEGQGEAGVFLDANEQQALEDEQQQQAGGNFFPPEGDPNYDSWAAGGVEH